MGEYIKRISAVLAKMFSLQFLLNTFKLPSAMLLIVVNLIPIFGVVVLKWNPYDILILYWLENIVIGIFNFLRMLFVKGDFEKYMNKETIKQMAEEVYGVSNDEITENVSDIGQSLRTPESKIKSQISFAQGISKAFLPFFFLIHYGIFNLVHGVLLFFLVARKSSFLVESDYKGLIIFFIALTISHGFSFIYNFIGKKEYLTRTIAHQMVAPYGRIVVIHTTIILGAFLASFLPNYIIIVFIAVKIVADLGVHLGSHIKLEEISKNTVLS